VPSLVLLFHFLMFFLLGAVGGYGDYNVRSNTLLGLPNAGAVPDGSLGPPMVINSTNGVHVKHREYITDVTSSTEFALNNYFLNPGLPATFPWLATVAQNFEQYKFHGVLFEFRSTSADALNSTNTALGTVIMGTDYNPASPNFVTKQQMENNEWTTSNKPSCTFIHPIECSSRETQVKLWYVRTGFVPDGQDQRLFDLANFQIAVVGSQAQAVIGELWVSYDVEFFKPVLSTATPDGGFGSGFVLSNLAFDDQPWGDSPPTVSFDNAGIQFEQGTGTNPCQVSWPAGSQGTWEVVMNWESANAGTTGQQASARMGVSGINLDTETLADLNAPYSDNDTNGLNGGTQHNFTQTVYCLIGDPSTPAVLNLNTSDFKNPGGTNGSNGFVLCTQIPDDVSNMVSAFQASVHGRMSDGTAVKCTKTHFEDLGVHDEPVDAASELKMIDDPPKEVDVAARTLKRSGAFKGKTVTEVRLEQAMAGSIRRSGAGLCNPLAKKPKV